MNFYNTKRNFFLQTLTALMVLASVFLCVSCLRYSSQIPNHVVINEVCSSNFSLIQNEDGLYPDYIELYNPGTESVTLDHYFLSDDKQQLQKYSLETITIPPNGFCIVWLNETDDDAMGQTGFQISKTGEEVYLSNADSGEIIDSVTIPALTYNTSYGRVEDGGIEWDRMPATAGSSNHRMNVLPSAELNAPVFSVQSGFYDEPFLLTIQAQEGETVYYTLDGSDPTPEGNRYEAPLEIRDATNQDNLYADRTDLSPVGWNPPSFKVDKGTVIRAISYNEQDHTISRIVTEVYFIGYSQREEYRDLPVISLVTDPGHLFDNESGIYGNGIAWERYQEEAGVEGGELPGVIEHEGESTQYLYMASNAYNEGKEWEREAVVTYFDSNQEYGFSQNVGIRIAGASSRTSPRKSFSIYGRDIYDENVEFPYIFFPNTNYSTLKIRSGGSNNDSVVITDAFLEALAVDRDVSIQRSTPCVLFLNGEYWGIYNIRERYREEYFSNHYGVNAKNLWFINRRRARIGDNEAQSAYQSMIDTIIACDLSFEDVYAMVCDLIDVQSLLDYLCINLYLDNRDINFGQNTALWRAAEIDGSEYGDGRWRWMLYDLDHTLHADSNSLPLSWMQDYELMNEPVIQSLMVSAQFRRQFCITFMDIANTTFSYETVQKELFRWKEIYAAQVTKTHQQFYNIDFEEKDFDAYIKSMEHFFEDRFPFAMESLASQFNLTGSLEKVTVQSNLSEAGMVGVNTVWIEDSSEWSGIYYTDYPLSLRAVAKEGYEFIGWSGDVPGANDQENPQIEVDIPEGGLTIMAVFEKSND